ncbi:hypothetical protein BuS5_02108 [Desulfosarcina sp. BuS5]|nr:hypothetical protein BuS5_02108 [Desulfosarcina sp. BuS5]
MEAITYTAARQDLAKTMEKVCKDRAPVIVTPLTLWSLCHLRTMKPLKKRLIS